MSRQLATRPRPAALLAVLKFRLVNGLASGNQDEQVPEVVAVLELGKLALFGAAVETVEGAQRHVFLVRRSARRMLQLFACQTDEAVEIALPELLGNGRIAGFELANPYGHRARGGHRHHAPKRPQAVRKRAQL